MDPIAVDHLARYLVLDNECWEWTGPTYRNGYGHAGAKGLAHRFFYKELVGEVPDGMDLDHSCHNKSDCPGGWTCPHRKCVNPSHLVVATRSDNVSRGKRWNG